jgi:hypothetical protein
LRQPLAATSIPAWRRRCNAGGSPRTSIIPHRSGRTGHGLTLIASLEAPMTMNGGMGVQPARQGCRGRVRAA